MVPYRHNISRASQILRATDSDGSANCSLLLLSLVNCGQFVVCTWHRALSALSILSTMHYALCNIICNHPTQSIVFLATSTVIRCPGPSDQHGVVFFRDTLNRNREQPGGPARHLFVLLVLSEIGEKPYFNPCSLRRLSTFTKLLLD